MATAAGETADGISHDFWWWLALGFSGFFIVLLMFTLLFSWSRSLDASASVPASSLHSRRRQEKQDSVGLFDSATSVSPAMTAVRHASTGMVGTNHGSGEASVSLLQHADHTNRCENTEMMAAALEGGVMPLSHYGEPPAPRPPVTTTVLLEGHRPKKVTPASSRRSPDIHFRSAATVSPRAALDTPPAAASLPKQPQSSTRAQRHRRPNDLGEVTPEADVDAAVSSLENPLTAAGLHRAGPKLLVDLVGGSTLHSTPGAAAGEGRGGNDTPRDFSLDEPTFSGVPALAWHGKPATQPIPPVPLQRASSQPQRSSSSDAVKQYYFGFKRSQDTAATAACSEFMPRRAWHEAAHAPAQRRSSQARRRPVDVESEPAPGASREAPLTNAPFTTAAAAALALTPHDGAVFKPLTLTLATMCPFAARESGDATSLTELEPSPQRLHVAGEDGAAAAGAAACRSSPCELQHVSSLSPRRLRSELFRASGECGPATVKAAVCRAQLDKRPVARLHSTDARPTRQLLILHAAPALANSKLRGHWRDRPLSSQPPVRSRSGASSSSAAQRTASAGSATAERSVSTTVTKGVPQLFFGKRGASPVRPPVAAASSQPTTAAAKGTRSGSGVAAARRPPIAKPLSVDYLTEALTPALVSPSALSSVSPQPAAASAARGSSTPTRFTATGGASVSPSGWAVAPHRGSFSSSMNGRSPLRNSPRRKRSASLVTFLDKDDVRVGSGSRGGHAPPPLAQQVQLPQSCELSAGSPSSFYASLSVSGSGGAARLERLSDPAAGIAATGVDVAPVLRNAGVSVAQGHRSCTLPSAAAAVERRQVQSPATREPSAAAPATPPHSATTATPLELATDVAARRAPAALGPPAFASTRHRGGGATAAAALTAGPAEEGGRVGAEESCDGDDGDSVSSGASTIAAGMLPDAPRCRRGTFAIVPPAPTVASQQQQLHSTASGYSDGRQQLFCTSGIEVPRITHPTGVVQESPAPPSTLARDPRHCDLTHTASYYPSTTSSRRLLAAHSNAALPARPHFSGVQVAQASATRSNGSIH